MLYNKDHFASPPDSWELFWDPEMRGHIQWPTIDWAGGFFLPIIAAILGGGDQYNMDPAWPKLKELVDNKAILCTSQNLTQMAEFFKSGDLWIGTEDIATMKPYIDAGYPIGITRPKEGVFLLTSGAVRIKGHKAPDKLCDLMINECLGPDNQLGLAESIWYGPTNSKVNLPKELKGIVPASTPEDIAKGIPMDFPYISTQRPGWVERLSKMGFA